MHYDTKECNQFVSDMEAAGLEVEHYRGRFYWEGPAVRVDNLQDALSETKVKCQYDSMGPGSFTLIMGKAGSMKSLKRLGKV